ncbi:YcxB family protein [Streptomyces sp. HMX87]|uniref:YcxB family protein n=1 Tax=Streptomyces sp. HMX87 TaxID=3390849 RepID=UPI003A863A1B
MENKERRNAPGPAAVEVVYLPSRSDMAEALRARTSPAARWRFPLTAGLITAAVVIVLQVLGVPEGATAVAAAGAATTLGSLLGGWVNRLHQVRQMTRYARSQGAYTMRADDEGIDAVTAVAESRIPWSSFRYSVETVNLFVLDIDDTVGGMALLPKRGLRDGADVDGMRALVARHLPTRPPGA